MVIRRAIPICLAVLIATTCIFFSPANQTKTGNISLALESVLELVKDEDYVSVGVFVEEIDVSELKESLFTDFGFSRESIAAFEEKTDLPIEAVQRYVKEERLRYATAQAQINRSVLKDILDSTPCGEYYVSEYSPCIFLSIKKEDLALLQRIKNVVEIDYFPELTIDDCDPIEEYLALSDAVETVPMNDYFETIGATAMRDNYHYTGEGIKIGQIEVGVPDTTKSCFSGASITIKPGTTHVNHPHASRVASILVSQLSGARGIVPDASLYCAEFSSFDYLSLTQMAENIEWLISQGCNIINMSAGIDAYHGYYGSYSKWIDHIAINHSVHFVVAAGNKRREDGSLLVPCTSMGYNCITVGNITNTGWVNNSCYVQEDAYADKPDISCFGVDVGFPSDLGSSSGTSYSTPMVTGVLTQLCEYKASLLVLQDRAKAAICASIPYPYLMYSTGTEPYHKSGAGLISSTSSRYTIARGFSKESYFSASDTAGTYKTYTFTLSGDTISRVCLTWLKYNKFTSSCLTALGTVPSIHAELANLDLEIYDSSGSSIISSTLTSGNMEIVQFIPNANETYTVRVVLTEPSTRKVYFGLAWW